MKITTLVRFLPMALGLLLTAGTVLLLVARVARTVEASGEVRIDRYQIVRPKVSGIVAEVLAEPGETVRSGQVLCKLSNYDFERQQLAVRQQLHDAQAQRLALDDRRRQLLAEIHPLEQTQQTHQLTSSRLQDRVSDVRRRELEIELKRSEELLQRRHDLREAGLISEQELNEAVYDKLQAEQRFEQSQIEQSLAGEQVTDAESDFELLKATQRRAVADLDSQRQQLTLLIDQLSADLEKLDEISRQYVLHAEIDGVMVGAPVYDLLGRKVESGEELFSIIDLAAIHFATYVPEQAILKVRAGQEAYVELTGLPRRNFDVFSGEVQKVAAEPLLQQAGEAILYPVEIRLRQPWVVWEGNRFYVRSGMRGQAKISYRGDVSLLRAIYESLAGEPGVSVASSPVPPEEPQEPQEDSGEESSVQARSKQRQGIGKTR